MSFQAFTLGTLLALFLPTGKTMNKLIKVFVLLSTALLAFADNSNNGKVSPDLQQQSSQQSAQSSLMVVIVQYKTPPSKDELNQLGSYGQIKKQYSVINGVQVSLSADAIKQISADPNVAYITPDRQSKGSVDISTGTVSANLVWSYGYTGTGVGIAVIDSGVTLKNDLKNAAGASRVVYSQSFVPGVSDTSGI